LKKLEPYLVINYEKSGVMELTEGVIKRKDNMLMGFPIVTSYKYLGVIVTPNTT